MDDLRKKAGGTRGRLDVPFDDSLSNLPETAQKIFTAARKLLIEGGYEAMTLENVAGEPGVVRSTP